MGSRANLDHIFLALIYDERMCKHADPNDPHHPESPLRIKAIWKKLESAGILRRCAILSAKEAEDKHIQLVHTGKHTKLIRSISSRYSDSQRNNIASKLNSIYFNKGSSEAAYLSAGAVIEVCERVAKGEFTSAVAIVRPPGHHAEPGEAMGFCLFNNVGIAASFLLNERPELGIQKILIVDWDVHHGNGTQKMFWKDPRVLFFSAHRFDFGTFYPAGDDGSHHMIGEGLGAGYNINVPWEHSQCGDADYLAAWDHVLLPVANAFNPDIILVSGGFDAAIGDPLGGCCVTPVGYSIMMKKLMDFAGGRIVMALEGGYNLNSLANSVLACVETLLGEELKHGSSEGYPWESTMRVIQAVRKELSPFWPILADALPQDLVDKCVKSCTLQPANVISFDSDEDDGEINVMQEPSHFMEAVEEVIQPLLMLKVEEQSVVKESSSNYISPCEETPLLSSEEHQKQEVPLPAQVVDGLVPWRSIYSKIHIWYASYGSNMWKSRFHCYIEGGQVGGMQKRCSGSVDIRLPEEIIWKTVPHRLVFAWSWSRTWGPGGAAFLHPESRANDRAHICMYKITLEQFNDVLLQENFPNLPMETPLFDLSALTFVAENKSMHLEALKGAWYSNIIYLGMEQGLPILTMTCPISDFEKFKSGELPVCAPAKDYADALVKGLVEGKQLSEEEAVDYIRIATTKEL